MAKHWDELSDKGPQIEEPRYRYQKRGGGKKPFTIERRFVGCKKLYGAKSIFRLFEGLREWHVFKRYKTEKQRDQAFKAYKYRKSIDTYSIEKNWEYRKGE